MFFRDLSVLEDTDIYIHTLAVLTPLSQNPKTHGAIRCLKLLSSRPIQDLDLVDSARGHLTNLREYLLIQASPDYWFDNFVGFNGEIEPRDLEHIQELVEERVQQIRHIDSCLSRLV